MLIRGACHCGNISFTLEWSPAPAEIRARQCGCTFCTKHGGVWVSYPQGRLRVSVRDSALVSLYEFGTRTAQFHVCGACGVVPLVTSRIEGRLYAVVSVHAFENLDRALIKVSPAQFDGETEEVRLARRARGWIADVEFTPAG